MSNSFSFTSSNLKNGIANPNNIVSNNNIPTLSINTQNNYQSVALPFNYDVVSEINHINNN